MDLEVARICNCNASLGSDARRGLKDHPTVKPTAMLEDALLNLTNRGEIVIDPFLGSGSTLIAADNTGRVCRGVELDPLYVDVIVRGAPQQFRIIRDSDVAMIAQACSLEPSDIEVGRHPPCLASCGAPFVIAEVRDRTALRRAQQRMDVFLSHLPRDEVTGIHLYVEEAEEGADLTYGFGELDTLVSAYAATIHKSQGSEYPAVVIPVMTQHYAMLQRNLLYTGVTRGKRLVVLVGQKKAIAIAVHNVSGRRRWSKHDAWLRAGAPSQSTNSSKAG